MGKIKAGKRILTLAITEEKIREFKKKAIDANMTLSDFVTQKLSDVEEPKTIKEFADEHKV